MTNTSAPAARWLGQWRPLYAEPFRGITTDGVPAHELQPNGAPSERMVDAAERWLSSLNAAQRLMVTYPIDARAGRDGPGCRDLVAIVWDGNLLTPAFTTGLIALAGTPMSALDVLGILCLVSCLPLLWLRQPPTRI